MRYYLLFGAIAIAVVAVLYPVLYNRTDWNPYAIWITAFTAATFTIYGLDTGLSVLSGIRAPEKLLHLLALLGGFPGGWLGMFVFRHKINRTRHLDIWIVLLLSTLGHIALTYLWFF
jgi:uncharacterized membrane protein YsdA (DUF1294 family)